MITHWRYRSVSLIWQWVIQFWSMISRLSSNHVHYHRECINPSWSVPSLFISSLFPLQSLPSTPLSHISSSPFRASMLPSKQQVQSIEIISHNDCNQIVSQWLLPHPLLPLLPSFRPSNFHRCKVIGVRSIIDDHYISGMPQFPHPSHSNQIVIEPSRGGIVRDFILTSPFNSYL